MYNVKPRGNDGQGDILSWREVHIDPNVVVDAIVTGGSRSALCHASCLTQSTLLVSCQAHLISIPGTSSLSQCTVGLSLITTQTSCLHSARQVSWQVSHPLQVPQQVQCCHRPCPPASVSSTLHDETSVRLMLVS